MTVTTGTVSSREELHAMARLADAVFSGGGSSFAARYPETFSMENAHHLLRAVDDGELVAGVASYPARLRLSDSLVLNTLAVGAVCTAERYRGRGISATLLAHLKEEAKANGVHLILISGEGPLYLRMGARQVGTLFEVQIPRSRFPGSVQPYERHVVPDSGALDAAWRSFQGRSVRFERRRAEFEGFMTGHLAAFEGETAALLVPRDGQGFAVVRTSMEGDSRVAFLVEWAGDDAVAFDVALDEARAQGCDKLYTRIEDEAPTHLRDLATPIPITGTVAVADVGGFLDSVANHVALKGGPALDYSVSGDRAVIGTPVEVIFDGAIHDIAPFFFGSSGTSTAPPVWRLPSFRIDNLNFL